MKFNPPPHPFPARMAPEVALDALQALSKGSTVLDPMCGSGTVLRVASELGHQAIGFDVDPLSVLMAKVWITPTDGDRACAEANKIIQTVKRWDGNGVSLPWIDNDPMTVEFVNFWFSDPQKYELRKLGAILYGATGTVADILRLSLSRMIVTKGKGASVARDVSHSRPHRVSINNDYDVLRGFCKSIRTVAHRIEPHLLNGRAVADLGDARDLHELEATSVDAIVTSPPYLNAIDYLRGHRLSLVWLGYNVRELRDRRSHMVGSERAPDSEVDGDYIKELLTAVPEAEQLGPRFHRIFERFVGDLGKVMTEAFRVLRPGGKAIYVIGDSTLRGVFVRNTELVIAAAQRAGLTLVAQSQRELPPMKRYLPPPGNSGVGPLSTRMRTESVLSFARAVD